jgi:hypothetical protein
MKKLIIRGLLVLVLLLLLALGAGILFLDPIVRSTLEKGGSAATGVETRVDDVDVGLTGSRFELSGLRVANPPGFSPQFLQLGHARAAWDGGTLFAQQLEIREVGLEGLELHLERNAKGTNWGPILDNLERLGGGKKEPAPERESGARSVHIAKLEIRGTKVTLEVRDVPAISGSTSIELPTIVLQDLRSNGSATEIVAKILRAVVGAVIEQSTRSGAGVFPKDVLSGLTKDVDAWKGKLDEELRKTGVEDLLKGAGDLFKKKK